MGFGKAPTWPDDWEEALRCSSSDRHEDVLGDRLLHRNKKNIADDLRNLNAETRRPGAQLSLVDKCSKSK